MKRWCITPFFCRFILNDRLNLVNGGKIMTQLLIYWGMFLVGTAIGWLLCNALIAGPLRCAAVMWEDAAVQYREKFKAEKLKNETCRN